MEHAKAKIVTIPEPTSSETAINLDRRIVAAGLAGLVILAAVYTAVNIGLVPSATNMTAAGDALAAPAQWPRLNKAGVFLMWWIMLIAMLVPSAAPMILLYTVLKRRHPRLPPWRHPLLLSLTFLAGYLAVWAAFAAAMTALQAMLTQMQLLTPALQIKGPLISGAIFLAAGLYQFSQLKKACLAQCQSPIRFLTKRRRHGNRGAWRMGLEHGAICLGCCGGLMLLLFAGGVLNFFWIAGLAVFVSVEKLLPGGRRFGRYVAILLCGIGLGWIIFPDF